MTMRMGAWAVGLCALMLVSGAAQARHGWDEDDDYDDGEYEEVISCESHDHRQNYCDIDGYGDVVLVNQLSRTACIEGSTWGSNGRSVWVSDGCRGEFAVVSQGGERYGGGRYGDQGLPNPYPAGGGGGGWQGDAYAVRCESRGHDYTYCPAPIRGTVEIQEQLSLSSCDYGSTWGYDRRGIWVDEGCRAEFVIY